MRKLPFSILAGFAALFLASPAQAQIACSNTDITVPGGTVTDCSGFVLGNIINSNGANQAQLTSLLLDVGFVYTGDSDGIEQFDSNSLRPVDFARLLTGDTIIGVHYGNGQGSPGRPQGSRGDGGDTAFYRFNAGGGVNVFDLNFNSGSTVTLFQTGIPAVPEPGTWAMMLIGFGGIGYSMRRRRKTTGIAQLA